MRSERGERRAAVGVVVLAMDFEPRDRRVRGEHFAHVRRAQADAGRGARRPAARGRLWQRGRAERLPGRFGEHARTQAFGAVVLPPIFSHSPLLTYFHSIGSLSVFAPNPAQACLAVPQSFWPALAMP